MGLAALLDWLLPPLCLGCGGSAWEDPARGLCDRCARDLPPPERRCRACGRVRGPSGTAAACPRCTGPRAVPDALARPRGTTRARAIRGVVAAWRYRATARDLVRRLKFGRVAAAARPLVEGLAEAVRAHGVPGDLVVPVPLAVGRRLRRGFDQAAVLAAGLGRRLGVEVDVRALCRVRATPPQARRRGRVRASGLGGAFRARSSRVRGRCVLLVDDVLTSGATARAAAHALRRAGALSVHVVVACRSEAGHGRRARRRPRRSTAPWAGDARGGPHG